MYTSCELLHLDVRKLMARSCSQTMSVGNYLLARLEQLKVTSIFGVPGDFNLAFLDMVEDHPTIDWVGNCNELNAAYAADGHARIKENSVGVVLTTFGVGELSAINGIAGAFAEGVPVIHLVGVPSAAHQKKKAILHHTLGDGRYDAYQQATAHFVVYEANLSKRETAAADIDAALTECITRGRPVYISLPTDLVNQEIYCGRLLVPLSTTGMLPPNNPEMEEFVLDLIQKCVDEAEGDVVVLVDAGVARHHCRREVHDFLAKTGFPVYAAPMGKTVIDENYERYGGIYMGALSRPSVRDKVENARLILSIGLVPSDFNTGNFTYTLPTSRLIQIRADHCEIQYGRFDRIAMKLLLPKLAERVKHFHTIAHKIEVPPFLLKIPQEDSEIISHTWFWPRVGSFFKPKDVIVTETGTSLFGIIDVPLPGGAILVSQGLWGSVGWSVGSTLGASLAGAEAGKERVILFIGDGGLQVAIQELSSIIGNGLKPIIFVLNNKGYTIERCIREKDRRYHDIADWNWTALLDAMNRDKKHETASYTARTKDEMERLLGDAGFAKADKIQLVEVVLDKYDAPKELLGMTNFHK